MAGTDVRALGRGAARHRVAALLTITALTVACDTVSQREAPTGPTAVQAPVPAVWIDPEISPRSVYLGPSGPKIERAVARVACLPTNKALPISINVTFDGAPDALYEIDPTQEDDEPEESPPRARVRYRLAEE